MPETNCTTKIKLPSHAHSLVEVTLLLTVIELNGVQFVLSNQMVWS